MEPVNFNSFEQLYFFLQFTSLKQNKTMELLGQKPSQLELNELYFGLLDIYGFSYEVNSFWAIFVNQFVKRFPKFIVTIQAQTDFSAFILA